MEQIRVIEAFHNLFYSPLYVTEALGLFEQEELDVSFRPRNRGENVVPLLRSGEFDIGLTGIMRSLVSADEVETDYPIAFAEVNSRDGFMLLSREPRPDFQWRDVEGKTLISYKEPPTPWMCLLSVLKAQGIEQSQLDLTVERPIPDAIDAFKQGFGDFIQLPEPLAEQLIVSGDAHFATSMGRYVGVVPYSSFACAPAFIEQRPDTLLRFTRALYAGQRWIADHNATEIAPLAAKHITGIDLSVIVAGVERYKAQDTWAADPLMRPEGFHRLQDILRDGGLIKGHHRYEDQVTTQFADAVMAEG